MADDNAKIRKLLDTFDKAKEWADLAQWLIHLNQELQAANVRTLQNKDALGKRLSQCLSQALPASVHVLALESYNLVFKRLNAAEDGRRKTWGNFVGYLSPGLFLFYQFAKLEAKAKFLDMIRSQYLKMGRELLQTLPGLIGCLLLTLDDQNGDIAEMTGKTMEELEKKVGTRVLCGCVWQAAFHTSKIRVQSLKFLNKLVPTAFAKSGLTKMVYEANHPLLVTNNGDSPLLVHGLDFAELVAEPRAVGTLEDFAHHYYPNKLTLVCNAIMNCFEDESVMVQRAAYDFVGSHFSLTENVLSSHEKVYLSVAACRSVLRKNESVIRRLYAWLFDSFYPREGEIASAGKSEAKFGLALHKAAFALLLEPKNVSQLKLAEGDSAYKKSVVEPIIIVKRIVEDNEEIVKELFPEIATYVIRYLEYYYVEAQEKCSNLGEAIYELKTVAKGLLFGNETRIVAVWQSFGIELDRALSAGGAKKDVLELISHVKLFMEILKTSGADANYDVERLNNSCITPTLARLLISVQFLSESAKDPFEAIPALSLIKELLELMKLGKNKAAGPDIMMASGLKKFTAFYDAFVVSLEKGLAQKDLATRRKLQEILSISTAIAVILQPSLALHSVLSDSLNLIVVDFIKKTSNDSALLVCIEAILHVFRLAKDEDPSGVYSQIATRIGEHKDDVPEIMSKLWKALGPGSVAKKAAELIIRAEEVLAEPLVDCIMLDLRSEQLASIHKFSRLWVAVEEYYPGHILFKNDPRCVCQMLAFLNHDHPIVSHACKSWLESVKRLGPILDPIFAQLLLATNEESEVLNREYDTRRVMHLFKLVRSVLQANKEPTVGFLLTAELSPDLGAIFNGQNNKLLLDSVKHVPTPTHYISLMLYTLIKYIICRADGTRSTEEFVAENTAVNACASDLLRLVLTSLDSPLTFAQIIIEPLMSCWHNAFASNSGKVMQVELLHLIKAIQFHCRSSSPKYAETCRKIFGNEYFMGAVKAGLKANVAYVREAYIGYITESLEFFVAFLGPKLESFVQQSSLALISQIEGYLKQDSQSEKGANEEEDSLYYELNENDVAKVLSGIKALVHFVLIEGERFVANSTKDLIVSAANTPGIRAGLQKAKTQLLYSLRNLIGAAAKLCHDPSPSATARNFRLSKSGILSYGEKDHSATLDICAKQREKDTTNMKELSGMERSVFALLQPLCQAYPGEFVKETWEAWESSYGSLDDSLRRKLIDVLITLAIPVDVVLKGLPLPADDPKKDPIKGVTLSFPEAQHEAGVCHFLYSFLVYSRDWYHPNEKPEFATAHKRRVWDSALPFLTKLAGSRQPTTLCWALDLLWLLSIKYNPGEISTAERRFRRAIEDLLTVLFDNITSICAYPDPDLPKTDLMFNPALLPLNPSVYEGIAESQGEADLRGLYPGLETLLRGKKEGICFAYLKAFCFTTTKERLYDVSEKLLGAANKAKMKEIVSAVMKRLFPIIASKAINDQFFAEMASDVLFSVLRSQEEYGMFKRQIVDIFCAEGFFAASETYVKKWKQIMNLVATYDGGDELFKELLNRVGSSELLDQFKAIKRLSFVVFSATKDQYDDYYLKLLTRMFEGLRDAVYADLVIEYLTLLRVLIMKFGQLNDPVKDSAKNLQVLWPQISYKLSQMSENWSDATMLQAGLKLLEAMSVLNLEDHKLFQWAFVPDYFGLDIVERDAGRGESTEFEMIVSEQQEFVPFSLRTLPLNFTATVMNEPLSGKAKSPACAALEEEKKNSPAPSSKSLALAVVKPPARQRICMPLVFSDHVNSTDELSDQLMKYMNVLSLKNEFLSGRNEEMLQNQLEKDFAIPMQGPESH